MKEHLYDGKHCCPNRTAELVDHGARGLLAVILGLIALLAPRIALLAFIYVFAAYALVDGGIALQRRRRKTMTPISKLTL